MKSFPASFPHTIWFFSDYFLFFSHGFCQFWEQSVDENLPCILSPILFDFFLIIFCFFLRVFASFENNLWMRTFPASFPHTIWFFSDYFLFFSHGFCQFWEQSVDENLPCILSPYCLIFFWLFFVFFSGFLPVLRTICGWEPSLHPFPILFDFFMIIFFSQGFCQFWEHSVHEHLPCILSPYYLIFFWFFFESWFCLHYFLFFEFVFYLIFFWFSIKSSILELSGLYSLTNLELSLPLLSACNGFHTKSSVVFLRSWDLLMTFLCPRLSYPGCK